MAEDLDGKTIAADQLRLFCERYERLDEEKKGLSDDQKDVMLEAKAAGFEPKAVKAVIRLRKMEKHVRDEQDALLELYRGALNV